MSYPYIIQGNQITVVIDNKVHTVGSTHITYDQVKQAIKDGDWQKVQELIDPRESIVNFSEGNIQIVDNIFYWKDREMHNSISTRIIEMLKEGFNVAPMVAFMNNVMKNPSKRSVDQLYGFLDVCSLPITPDGYFLAYKKVRHDYMDCYTGTISNRIGEVVEMNRNEVDDDPNSTCSSGLHFCSLEYLNHFGGERTMILKINPADVVSIPTDYNNSKGRCCRYEVVGEIDGEPERAFDKPVHDDWTLTAEIWTSYTGGGAPLPTDTDVQVQFRNGRTLTGKVGDFGWRIYDNEHDIVSYRII